MGRILVVHTAGTADTRRVAEAIATAATAAGATVHVACSDSVRGPLLGWDLVVLGAPLRHGRWHQEAHRFLYRYRDDLGTVPVAVFGLASAHAHSTWERNRAGLDRALEQHNWLVPVAVTLFEAGRPRGGRPILSGLLDWRGIGDWARKLVAELGDD